MRQFLLAAPFALAACGLTLPPPPPSASLPADAVQGAGDPVRAAVTNTTTAFGSPGMLSGRPAQAARSIAQMEFLAVELPYGARYGGGSPSLLTRMATARSEWRTALGIPAGVPPQPVIDALYRSARAMEAGMDPSATLPPDVFTAGARQTVAVLSALPNLPATNLAAVEARTTLERRETSGRGRF